MTIINLGDRRNENAKRQRGDEMRRLCNRLRWFLAADSADKRLTKESLKTAAALDVIRAEYEREAANVILQTRRLVFGFVDIAVDAQQFKKSAIGKRADVKLAGSINNGAVALSGGMRAAL